MCTVRAVVYEAIGAQPEVREVATPHAPDGGVVVEVWATGLCHSDWFAWAGHDDIALPHVPGHELAGVIVEVGAGVQHWHVGDRVTAPFVCGCGRCEWCLRGDAQICPNQQQPGFTYWGSFAERVVLYAADTNLVRVADGIAFETAAALGCRFATAFRALNARARLQRGECVVIVGAGGVGLSAVMIAHALGARVVAVDRNPDALARARDLGADDVVATSDGDVPTIVHELTDGGAHVSVDAVGSQPTCTDAILSLRRRGRHVQIGLTPGGSARPQVPMDRVVAWELDILGSHGMAASDYPEMLSLIADGSLQPQRLIARTVGLEEAARLLPQMDASTATGITMIRP